MARSRAVRFGWPICPGSTLPVNPGAPADLPFGFVYVVDAAGSFVSDNSGALLIARTY